MSTRHPLPGGQWAELLDPNELFGADQDAFLDEYDRLIQQVPQQPPQPDPNNPAVALPAPPRTLGRAGNRELQDWILAKVVKAWSFPLELPCRAEYRTQPGEDGKPVIPLPSLNALTKAAKAVQNALLDIEDEAEDSEAPKSAAQSGSGGSGTTSGEGTPSLLPAPPAVTSGTP